jgi:hypothetical protein
LDSAQSDANKQLVRRQISRPDSFWSLPALTRLPKVEQLLQACFAPKGSMRPTASAISGTLFDAWTELKYAQSSSAAALDEHPESVVQAKEEALALVQKSRIDKPKTTTGDHISAEKVQTLYERSGSDPIYPMDPTCAFLVGALVWHQLLPSDWVENFDTSDGGKSTALPSTPISYTVTPALFMC